MDYLISQVSYPVFMYMVWVFFLITSIFVLLVGIGLALRNAAMLRFFDLMNRWISVRKWMRPLSVPHYVEPAVLKHRILMGGVIVFGAAIAIMMLKNLDTAVFYPVYLGLVAYPTAIVLADYTKSFLLVGNALGLATGLLMLLAPRWLSRLEAYLDMWYSVRKRTQALTQMHHDVDHWVLAHPTVSGIALIVMSLGLMASVFPRI